MSRIFALGAAPLPQENLLRQYAANLRTWHLLKPLLEDGHEVRLVACRLLNTYPDDAEPEIRRIDGALEYISINGDRFHDPAVIQAFFNEGWGNEKAFDAVLGINSYMASRAAIIETDKPIWCDLNGWIMAEAQTKTYVYDDDRYLSHFWNMEHAVIQRADVISTVSDAQAYATVGELATQGRLGRKNFGHDFVHTIPNAISEIQYEHSSKVIRGVKAGEKLIAGDDDFVVLWAGGYNTWTDVDLLFEALTTAMAENPKIRFVSTGGMIEGHDEITFVRFRERIDQSPFADRFHFAGWVPTADVPSYYFESDLGLNVDSANYETTFGARNRLNEMMKVGLAMLTTVGTEISRQVASDGIGLSAPLGDAAAFAERIIWASRNPKELAEMAAAAQRYGQEHFSYGRTTEPLRNWAKNPQRAPDLGEAISFREDIDFNAAQDGVVETADSVDALAEAEARNEALNAELASIHSSKMWALWMKYLAVRRLLLGPFGRS